MGLIKKILGLTGIPAWTSGTVKKLVIDDKGLLYSKTDGDGLPTAANEGRVLISLNDGTWEESDARVQFVNDAVNKDKLVLGYGTANPITGYGAAFYIENYSTSPGIYVRGTLAGSIGIRTQGKSKAFTAYQTSNRIIFSIDEDRTINFYHESNGNKISFIAPSTMPGNVQYTLPEEDGTAGQVLSTDGSGNLSWVDN